MNSGTNSIDALVAGSWKTSPRTAATVTYAFLAAPPAGASADDANGFAPMGTQQMAAVRQALALWAAVANITFVEVKTAATANIRFGTNDQGALGTAGYAGTPTAAAPHAVDVYLSNTVPYNSDFTPGSYGPAELLHEIGHALGLKHPDSAVPGNSATLPASTDNGDYTQMSLNDTYSGTITGMSGVTPMLYDIMALQYLYGANTRTRSGDDTYAFNNTAAPTSIWDGGGTNTVDFSACTGGSLINLNAGRFSSTMGDLGNVSIAYGVLVQRAIGSASADIIFANDAGNTIAAGAGADTVCAGAGSDRIDGGADSDTVIFSRPMAAYSMTNSGTTLTVTGEGVDQLVSVETLRFADQSLALDNLVNIGVPLADSSIAAGTPIHLAIPPSFAVGGQGTLYYNATLADGSALPAWLLFDSTSAVFVGTPSPTDNGVLALKISVRDGVRPVSASGDFYLTVTTAGSTLAGTSGNDKFQLGIGNDSVSGGAGLDVAIVGGPAAQFKLAVSAGSIVLTDTVGKGGVDTLSGVERLVFADGALAFDTTGAAGQTFRLYQAAFDRLPDLAGLGFWIDARDRGVSAMEVANSFLDAPEFVRLYGSGLSNEQFATQLYVNVLHRQPDAAGLQYHIDNLNGTNFAGYNPNHEVISRAQTLIGFSESTEYIATVTPLIATGIHYTLWI